MAWYLREMKNKLNFDYISLQFIYYITAAVTCGYGAYLLTSIGYSSSMSGKLMSIGCLLSLIIQPILAQISDNSKKYNIFRIGTIMSCAGLLVCCLAYFFDYKSLVASILFIAMRGIHSAIEPLINSVPEKLQRHGYDVNFSAGRAIGSMSYAIFSTIAGALTKVYSYYAFYILSILSYILIICAYIVIRKHYSKLPEIENNTNKVETVTYGQFIKNHLVFVLLCVCFAGIFFSYAIPDNFMLFIIQNVNGSEQDMGLVLGFKAILELPTIFLYDRIEKHFSTKFLLKFGAVCYALKSVCYLLSKSMLALYLTQLLQPFSLALMVPAIVSFINQIMSEKEIVRGQSLYVMSMTLSSILATTIGGYLIEVYSVRTMLLACVIISTISADIFIFLVDRSK